MLTAIMLTSIASLFAIGATGLFTFLAILKNAPKNGETMSFALIWLISGLVFLLMGTRTTFYAAGYPGVDRFIAYIVQCFLPFIFVSVGYYVFWMISKNKKATAAVVSLYSFIGLIFVFVLFSQGIVGPEISEWGSEFTAPKLANYCMYLVAVIAVLFLMFNFISLLVKKQYKEKQFLATLSLLIFLFASIFEQKGNVGWVVLFWRIILLSGALVGYLAYGVDSGEVEEEAGETNKL